MICPRCGKELNPSAKFCGSCGAVVSPSPGRFAGSGAVREGIPAPGFSDRVNHPEVLAAMKKNRRASAIFGFIITPLPFIGFLIYGSVSKDMELSQAMLIGAVVSAVFLIFALIGLVKSKTAKPYDGTVVDKKSQLTYRHRNNTQSDEMITEYTTYVLTDDGKRKRIVEREGSPLFAFEYLQIGDRFRYHPQFVFPYELYDKSRAPYLRCVSCHTKNPVTADRCSKCGVPLLK